MTEVFSQDHTQPSVWLNVTFIGILAKQTGSNLKARQKPGFVGDISTVRLGLENRQKNSFWIFWTFLLSIKVFCYGRALEQE